MIRVPRRYVATEKLEGENQYDAVEHGKQDAEKGVSFVSFPPVLNLQLKRFDFDMATGDMVKVRRSSPPTRNATTGGRHAATSTFHFVCSSPRARPPLDQRPV